LSAPVVVTACRPCVKVAAKPTSPSSNACNRFHFFPDATKARHYAGPSFNSQ